MWLLWLTALATIFCWQAQAATKKTATPDFAYPKTVVSDARKSLNESLGRGDDIDALRSLIDLALAQNAITTDNVDATIATVDSTRRRLSAPQARSLASLLTASIYANVYNSQRWVFDNRSLPPTPVSDTCSLWSGEQFRLRINAEIDSALQSRAALQSEPLGRYGKLIEMPRTSAPYYPRLYDFIAAKSIELLSSLTRAPQFLAPRYLCGARQYEGLAFNSPRQPEQNKILELYASLLKFHEGDTAPFVNFDIERLDYIANNISRQNDFNIDLRHLDLLRSLFESTNASEYSSDILLAIVNRSLVDCRPGAGGASGWLYDQALSNVRRFPTALSTKAVKAIIERFNNPSVELESSNSVTVGSRLPFTLRVNNVEQVTVSLHDVSHLAPSNDWNFDIKRTPLRAPVKSIVLRFEGAKPFAARADSSFTLDRAGYYVLTVSTTPRTAITNIDRNPTIIHCSEIGLFTTNSGFAVAANTLDGAPVEGAKVATVPYDKRPSKTIGITDASGIVNLPADFSGNLYASKDGDRFGNVANFWQRPHDQRGAAQLRAFGLTDLAVYHPADTVRWMATVYQNTDGRTLRAAGAANIAAVLYDANSQPLDTITATTDDFGRSEGAFSLPANGLTGGFRIAVATYDPSSPKLTRHLTGMHFTVSDYKLPDFEITLQPAVVNSPTKGSVTLRGRIATFAGFPLANNQVTMQLAAGQPSFYRNIMTNSDLFYSTTATTNSDGRFEITLPQQLLDDSPLTSGYFQAEFTATAPNGETHSATTTFNLKPQYQLSIGHEKTLLASTDTPLPIKLIDSSGADCALPLKVAFVAAGDTVARFATESQAPAADLSNVASGRYTLVVAPDGFEANRSEADVVIFRRDDPTSPTGFLWVEQSDFEIAKSDTTVRIYAAPGLTHLFIMTAVDDNEPSTQWIDFADGHLDLPISIPESAERLSATLFTIRDGQPQALALNFVKRDRLTNLRFTVETFRDRLTPGNIETVTFKVKNASNDTGVKSALVLEMYNRALDDIALGQWNIGISRRSPRRPTITTFQPSDFSQFYYGSVKSTSFAIAIPDWLTYGMPLYSRWHTMMRSRVMKAAAINGMAESADFVEEKMVMASADFASAAGATIETEEAADEGIADNAPGEPTFQYRDAATPLAFFRPMLTTGPDGDLTFRFSVPNANASWTMQGVAFDESMNMATLRQQFTASKPLMVKANLPRFVRLGDSATIEATVMNNTDSIVNATTTIEYFNPLDSKVIHAETSTNAIEPMSSVTIATTFAPKSGDLAGYRIRTTCDGYADGEQNVIPILPATAPVVESQPFYMAPDQKEFTMTINTPAAPDAKTTLQFCDNPVWNVVTALPALYTGEASTAPEAAGRLFTAATALGILEHYPEVAEALTQWSSQKDNDSMLSSMLQRDSDLKVLLLSATPWLIDAQSDTERMARLALLLDRRNIDKSIDKAVATLEKLQRADGGLKWMSQSDVSSLWATETALALIGNLNALGFMPNNAHLSKIVDKAMAFVDQKEAEAFKKNPKADFTNYVYIRRCFPDQHVDANTQSVVTSTVTSFIANWKSYSIPLKAMAATILSRNNRPTQARQVIESLDQYASTSATKGMWWPSLNDNWWMAYNDLATTALILEAYRTSTPEAPQISQIGQWLTLQKEARTWGDGFSAANVVAQTMAANPCWVSAAKGAAISLGKHKLQAESAERYTGSFTSDITPLHPAGKKLTITKHGDTPAWGAVITQCQADMDNIKPASCDGLKIEKRIYRASSTPAGVEWIDATATDNSIVVGDKLKIELIVTCDRTIDYVAIIDDRAACFEPVEQLPQPVWSEGICFYRENRDSSTNIFVSRLPKGNYRITYEVFANNAGNFTSGIATAQSQYAPQLTAHSAGRIITVVSAASR